MGPSRLLPALAAAALLLGACAFPAQHVVNPKYSGGIVGRTVHVLPIAGVIVHDTEDFDRDLRNPDGSKPSEHAGPTLMRLFRRALEKQAEDARFVFDSISDTAALRFRDTLLEMPGAKKPEPDSFAVPIPDTGLAKSGGQDLGLVFEKLDFRRTLQAVPGRFDAFGLPGVGMGTIAKSRVMRDGMKRALELRGRYLLWDFRAGEPVAYGRFYVYDTYPFDMTKENWVNVVNQTVRKAINDSPLKAMK